MAIKLWVEGSSANEIARALGGVTRNAVIGVITRAGYARGPIPAPGKVEKVTPPKPPRARKPKPAPPAPPPARPTAVAVAFPVVHDPDEHGCRWPFGEPDQPGFGFCGRPRREGDRSYCAEHRRLSSGKQPSARSTKALESLLTRDAAPRRRHSAS